MKKRDKNIFIVTVFAIILLFAWSLSSYLKSKEIKEESKQVIAQENLQELATDNISAPETNLVPTITVQELHKKLFTQRNILIVDTRTVEEFKRSHLKDSIHISEMETPRTERVIVFITTTGNETGLVDYYNTLSKSNTVYNLKGGFSAWTLEDYNTISQNIEKNFLNASKIKFVEPRDLDALLNKDSSKVVVVDARRSGNFEQEKIPTAINIPFEELELKHAELPMTDKIFVYGFDEDAGFESGVLLYDLGHININVIAGGFEAWKKYGYPTQK